MLSRLDLSGCTNLQYIPESFGNLNKLTELDLSNYPYLILKKHKC